MTDISLSITGGSKMKEFLRKMAVAMGNEAVVKVGFLEGSYAGWNGPRPKGPRKGKRMKSDNSQGTQAPAAMVAFIMEHGAPEKNIPPRPFFSQMIAKNSPTWGVLIAAALKAKKYIAFDAMHMVGLRVSEQLQQSIEEFHGVPLKQATIDRKGFDTQLQDSRNMKNAVDHAVISGVSE